MRTKWRWCCLQITKLAELSVSEERDCSETGQAPSIDSLTDSEIFTRYRFNRQNIIDLVERVKGDIERITKVKQVF